MTRHTRHKSLRLKTCLSTFPLKTSQARPYLLFPPLLIYVLSGASIPSPLEKHPPLTDGFLLRDKPADVPLPAFLFQFVFAKPATVSVARRAHTFPMVTGCGCWTHHGPRTHVRVLLYPQSEASEASSATSDSLPFIFRHPPLFPLSSRCMGDLSPTC